MRTEIDNGISSVNFEANLYIYRRSKKLISDTRINQLKEKAQHIGNINDKIIINVWEKENEINKNPVTCISRACHCFNIKDFSYSRKTENIEEVFGTVSKRAKQTFKIIDNYLNNQSKELK